MMRSEKQRIILSIHHSKTDMKSRWKELSPESRQSIREEFGTWRIIHIQMTKNFYSSTTSDHGKKTIQFIHFFSNF